MSVRDWTVVAAWTGGGLTVLICTFCFTRSPIEILGDLYDWLREYRPRIAKKKYNGRRRYVEGDDGREGDATLEADSGDSGQDSTEEEVAA